MTVLDRITKARTLIILLTMIIGVCISAQASAKTVISVGLIADHFRWSDTEMIVGGRLTLRGAQFETRDQSGTGPLRTMWPFKTNVYFDRSSSSATLSFDMVLIGPRRDTLWLKNAQLYDLSDWFRIEAYSSSNPQACPSKTCPITIEGEILFGDPNGPDFLNMPRRSVRVTTRDFVLRDVTIDIEDLRSKATNGDVAAQYKLGTLYYSKDTPGIKQDYHEAYKWFRTAADHDYAPAQSKLGQIYLSGLGLSSDFAEGIRWWRIAAQNGDAEAQYNLSFYLWLGGQGVVPDHAESKKWLQKSADNGFAAAQEAIGGGFENGQAVKQDYTEAYFWYLLGINSVEHEDLPAKGKEMLIKQYAEKAAHVASYLTAEQIEEIKKRVSMWKPNMERQQ